MRPVIRPVGLLAAVALVGGCGEDSEPSKPAGDPAPATVEVAIENIEFVPKRVTARVGQRVRWTNADPVPHTVAANDGAEFGSRALGRGETFSFVPTKPGTVSYFCTIHEGQVGTLVVR